jgi:hypothetical protein
MKLRELDASLRKRCFGPGEMIEEHRVDVIDRFLLSDEV